MAHSRHDLCILIEPAPPGGQSRGIFFAPARGISAETVNEMVRSGRGLVACCLNPDRAFHLGLQTMQGGVCRPGRPQFLASVEAASCRDTGISAADRAETLRVLGDPAARSADLCTPGHIMPCLLPDEISSASALVVALELASLLTSVAAVAWCDILDGVGNVASAEYCLALAARLGCPALDASSLARPVPDPVPDKRILFDRAISKTLSRAFFGGTFRTEAALHPRVESI